MDKISLFKSIVIYTSKLLNLSDILIIYKPNDWFLNSAIASMFHQESYTIIVNTTWISSASFADIIHVAIHETRHAYQKAVVEYPNLMNHTESVETVLQWEKDFINYNMPSIESNDNYLNQSIEVDATRYSLIVYKDIIGKVIIDNS